MGTYDGTAPDGTQVRVHIDNLDAEFAYLLTCAPGDHSRWSAPMELRRVWDDEP
jgi:hypothetical protein